MPRASTVQEGWWIIFSAEQWSWLKIAPDGERAGTRAHLVILMQTHYVITLYFPLHFALFFDQAFHWPTAMGSLSFIDAVSAEETLYEYAILFCCTAVKCTTAAGVLKTIQNPRTSSFYFSPSVIIPQTVLFYRSRLFERFFFTAAEKSQVGKAATTRSRWLLHIRHPTSPRKSRGSAREARREIPLRICKNKMFS